MSEKTFTYECCQSIYNPISRYNKTVKREKYKRNASLMSLRTLSRSGSKMLDNTVAKQKIIFPQCN